MPEPWKKVRSTLVGDFRIFKLRSDVSLSPRTGEEHDFYVLDSVNWVNVIALTPDRRLVMIEQFRHGSNTVELEIPGGMMDAGETDPVATAARELREETGYAGEHARLLGKIWSNPAILSNRTFVRSNTYKNPCFVDAAMILLRCPLMLTSRRFGAIGTS